MKSTFVLIVSSVIACSTFAGEGQRRPAADDNTLRPWLENMVWHHRFNSDEIRTATGLDASAIKTALTRVNITPVTRPSRPAGS